MNNLKNKQKILKVCNDLLSGKSNPHFKYLGLCYDIYAKTGIEPSAILDSLPDYAKYPAWTCDTKFPVPSGCKSIHYRTAFMVNELWCKRTKYGRNRWEFVQWVASELTIELGEMK